MIIRTPNGDVQVRDMFTGADTIPPPSQGAGWGRPTTRRVNADIASGLPGFLRGHTLLSGTLGFAPLNVYEGDETGKVVAPTAEQFDLFRRRPSEMQTPFGFKSFMLACILGYGNGVAQKAKARGKVQALYPIAGRNLMVRVVDGELRYEVRNPKTGKVTTLTRADVLHIPGLLLDDPYIGRSPIVAAAPAVAAALGAQEYSGRFYDNDATPSGAITMPWSGDSQKARDMREFWEDRHRGGRNAHRLAVLFDGATYERIGVNALEAQIIEAQRWGVEDAARILGLPRWALGIDDANAAKTTSEQRNMELVQYSVGPWATAFEEAINADEDIFPRGSGLCCGFDLDALTRADMRTRYESWLKGRQAGWLSANDIRAKEDEPPIEGGDVYQTTPVGGAPELQPAEPADDDEDDEA